MLLKGTIYVTTDINLCISNLNMCKTVVIADDRPDTDIIPGKIGGSLLLPPYEAMTHVIDGEDDRFRYEYLQYLSTDPLVSEFVLIILKALVNGVNMIFLLDKEFDFGMILSEFFLLKYGIVLGTSNNSFGFDPRYTVAIINELYMNGFMEENQYLLYYPQEEIFDPMILQKLIYDSGLLFNNEHEAIRYFKKQSLLLKNGGVIRDAVVRLE